MKLNANILLITLLGWLTQNGKSLNAKKSTSTWRAQMQPEILFAENRLAIARILDKNVPFVRAAIS